MEKKKQHYSLVRVKILIKEGKWRATAVSIRDAFADFAYSPEDLRDHVLKLKNVEFYKSMTTHHDHTLWQDVYHSEVGGVSAYIKVQIFEDTTVVISFKKRLK